MTPDRTHVSHFMKGCTSLALPVRLGVKVHPVDPFWEVFFCDQVMDLPGFISHSVAKDSRISAAFIRFEGCSDGESQ